MEALDYMAVEQSAEDIQSILDFLKESAVKKTPQLTVKTKQEKAQELSDRKSAELDLWKTWKSGGQKPEHLQPLLASFGNVINSNMQKYKGRVEIPTAALEHEHKKAVVSAFKTYDPSKGTALGTHVQNNLKQIYRYVESNKNFARMPENVYSNVGAFNRVKADLTDSLGYEPDTQTIHDHVVKIKHPKLGCLSLKDIVRLNRDQVKSLIQTGDDSTDFAGVGSMSSVNQEVIHLITPMLTPEERLIHEYTFGLNGKPVLKPGAMVKVTKFSNPKVSKLRTSILNKMKPYLGEE